MKAYQSEAIQKILRDPTGRKALRAWIQSSANRRVSGAPRTSPPAELSIEHLMHALRVVPAQSASGDLTAGDKTYRIRLAPNL